MVRKITSEEVLDFLGEHIQFSLNEIEEHPENKNNGFIKGQYYAFVECLEIIILFWDKSSKHGLNFAAEERYHLD